MQLLHLEGIVWSHNDLDGFQVWYDLSLNVHTSAFGDAHYDCDDEDSASVAPCTPTSACKSQADTHIGCTSPIGTQYFSSQDGDELQSQVYVLQNTVQSQLISCVSEHPGQAFPLYQTRSLATILVSLAFSVPS